MRRFHSERGQSTALVITLLWVFIFFVAVVANVGQAVNRRIALQVAADAGAYTGASIMATGFNHLAYWNRHIQRMYEWVALSSNDFVGNICGCGVFPGACDEWTVPALAFAHTGYNVANTRIGLALQDRPRVVTEYNLADLFPGEDPNAFDMAHGDTEADALLINQYLTGETPLLIAPLPVDDGTSAETDEPLWNNETPLDWIPDPPLNLADSSNEVKTWTSVCLPTSWDMAAPAWWYRLPRFGRPYNFIWRLKAPATKALMFDSIIGPDAIPEMKAVGVARPVGDGDDRGDISKGNIGYRVKMVPASGVMLGGIIDDPYYKDRLRTVTH